MTLLCRAIRDLLNAFESICTLNPFNHPRWSIPDDYIDKRRFTLFFARDVLQVLVAELKAENAVAPE